MKPCAVVAQAAVCATAERLSLTSISNGAGAEGFLRYKRRLLDFLAEQPANRAHLLQVLPGCGSCEALKCIATCVYTTNTVPRDAYVACARGTLPAFPQYLQRPASGVRGAVRPVAAAGAPGSLPLPNLCQVGLASVLVPLPRMGRRLYLRRLGSMEG